MRFLTELSAGMSLGNVDDDVISGMLDGSHGSFSQGSLAGVIAPVTNPDIFASFSSHTSSAANFHQGGGLSRASSMSQAGLSNNPQARQQQQNSNRGNNLSERWAQLSDEKWMLDAKGEVLAMHANSSSAFGADFDSFMPTMMNSAPGPPSGGGLHRYHSAPSTFLQSLTEGAFTQMPAIGSSTMGAIFSEGGLTPITEQMDVERSGSGNSMNEFEQFLAPDSDFGRRAALSALGKPENSGMLGVFPALPSHSCIDSEMHSKESSSNSQAVLKFSGSIDARSSWIFGSCKCLKFLVLSIVLELNQLMRFDGGDGLMCNRDVCKPFSSGKEHRFGAPEESTSCATKPTECTKTRWNGGASLGGEPLWGIGG